VLQVLNIHKRIIDQPKTKVAELLSTLSTANDALMPTDKWPAMKLDQGLNVGSKGGHGPIRYTVGKYVPGELIKFNFNGPKGFDGWHQFEIVELNDNRTELVHTIDMNTSGTGTLSWTFAIRWLHDALMEDAFDKVENQFNNQRKVTEWSPWVKFLRTLLN